MEDEVSLRDLYLILKRSSKWIVGFTVAVAVLVYLVSSLLPPKYESEAVAQALVLQQNDNALSFPAAASVFRTLPDAVALGVGFNKQLETKGPYVTRVLGDAPVEVSARFDDKKNLLTLTVRGNDPAEVKQFAEALLAAFDDYVKDRVFQSAGANLAGALAQSRLDFNSVRSQIRELEASLERLPEMNVAATDAATLEAEGVAPNVARSSDPGRAYLGLALAKQQAQLANLNAEIASLEALAADPAQLRRLSEQTAQVNVLSPPPLPDQPVSPRPLFNTALAALLALMLAVFWAFVREAIAPEEEAANATPAPASPTAHDGAATTPK